MTRESRLLLVEAHMAQVAKSLRRLAWAGYSSGRPEDVPYIRSCRQICQETSTVLIFTRDTGHHTSGWWKNPDYERCWHLSLSPKPSGLVLPGGGEVLAELDPKTRNLWVRAFFGEDARSTWVESAYSSQGKVCGVEHFRLFCDADWKALLPRGEVYGAEFTEMGWRSGSQVLEEEAAVTAAVDPS